MTTRKDKLVTAKKMLDGKDTSPLDALTPDELAYLEARGFKHNGHTYVIKTTNNASDTSELQVVEAILNKLPADSYLHIQVEIMDA